MKRLSNLDVNGRLVKKGVTVHVPGKGVPGKVVKVSRGNCLVHLVGWFSPIPQKCEALEVVV